MKLPEAVVEFAEEIERAFNDDQGNKSENHNANDLHDAPSLAPKE